MGNATSIDRFLKTGSEVKSVVGIKPVFMARWLAKLLVNLLYAICFTILAMFGAWPAVIYLIYVAIDS